MLQRLKKKPEWDNFLIKTGTDFIIEDEDPSQQESEKAKNVKTVNLGFPLGKNYFNNDGCKII